MLLAVPTITQIPMQAHNVHVVHTHRHRAHPTRGRGHWESQHTVDIDPQNHLSRSTSQVFLVLPFKARAVPGNGNPQQPCLYIKQVQCDTKESTVALGSAVSIVLLSAAPLVQTILGFRGTTCPPSSTTRRRQSASLGGVWVLI